MDANRRLIFISLFISIYCGIGSCAKDQKQEQEGKRAPQEGDECEPADERWYPVPDDQSAFLFCEVGRKQLKSHRCNSNDSLFKVFDPKRQQCVVANEQYRWLLMAAPPASSTRKVGDTCVVNRDCSDGMYCNAGMCACYLNYIDINLSCIRVTSVCQGTSYYPELVNGKPRICSSNNPCPSGYVCRLEGAAPSAQTHGFCCLATEHEVCGQGSVTHLVNGIPAACSNPNSTDSCPNGFTCQLYKSANRSYCCKPDAVPIGSTPAPPPASTKARHVQHPDSFCVNEGVAYLYDGYPIVCNPNNTASCPKEFPCQKNEKINLHFCCQSTSKLPNVLPVPPPPSPPPPPPLPPLPGLVAPPESGTGPSARPQQQPPSVPTDNSIGVAIGARVVDFCGPSGRPFVFDGRPVGCSMNETLGCPPGYTCTIYQPFNASFCCLSSPPSESHLPNELLTKGTSPIPAVTTAIIPTPVGPKAPPSGTSVCGQWSSPYTYDGYPVTCAIHGTNSTCPPDYICQFHPPTTAHFCCRIVGSNGVTTSNPATISSPNFSTDGCPQQTFAARDQTGVIQVCDLLLAPDNCPTGTGCLYSSLFGRYQCCGARVERWPQQTLSTIIPSLFTPPPHPSTPSPAPSGSSTTKIGPADCPNDGVGFINTTSMEVQRCSPLEMDSCPGGYYCQWSQPVGRFLCCGVSAKCPNRGVAYVSAMTWEVQRCGADYQSQCPPGYSCQATSDGSRVCCSGGQFQSFSPEASLGKPLVPPPPNYLCPVGLPLNDQQSGGYRTCSETATCPSGYQCTPSEVGTVCCPEYNGKNPPLWYFQSPVNARLGRRRVSKQ